MAQRAYRSRKEATILSLKGRIDQLETTLEKMNETFLSFSDELMKLNILGSYPDLARALHRSTQRCLSLANEAMSATDNDCSDEPTNSAETATLDVQNNASKTATQSLYSDIQLLQWFQGGNEILPTFLSPDPLWNTATITSRGGEPHFVHRLQLACVEYGYRCLRNPDSSGAIAQRFDLPLRMLSVHDIITYFEALLKGKSHQYSEHLNIPFFSVGGAGTHYMHHKRTYSTKDANHYSTPRDIATQQVSHNTGGDWFDCYDVEEFLKENNVTLVRDIFPERSSSHSYGQTRNRYLSETESLNRDFNRKLINESALIDCKSLLSLIQL